FDHGARSVHPFARGGRQRGFRPVEHHAEEILQRQPLAIEFDAAHSGPFADFGGASAACAAAEEPRGKNLRYFSGKALGRPRRSQITCSVSPVAIISPEDWLK